VTRSPPAPRRYVAVGDSFCAGLETDAFEPWPVLVARSLARAREGPEFISLARHGATTADVVAEQLPYLFAVQPDLVTVGCGANDVLMTVRPDLATFGERFAALLDGLRERAAQATVLTLTYGDFPAFMPYRPRSRERVVRGMAHVNETIRELSRAAGVTCVDLAASAAGRRADSFGCDGIHASHLGHTRTARAVLATLHM
jgi:lysophospholipase L1-like esterase